MGIYCLAWVYLVHKNQHMGKGVSWWPVLFIRSGIHVARFYITFCRILLDESTVIFVTFYLVRVVLLTAIMLNHDWKFPLKLMTICEREVWVIFEKPKTVCTAVLLYKSVLLFCLDIPIWNKCFKLSWYFTFLQVRQPADASPTEKQIDLSSKSSGQYAKTQFASCQWWWPGWDTHSGLWINHRFKVSKSEKGRNMFWRR